MVYSVSYSLQLHSDMIIYWARVVFMTLNHPWHLTECRDTVQRGNSPYLQDNKCGSMIGNWGRQETNSVVVEMGQEKREKSEVGSQKARDSWVAKKTRFQAGFIFTQL